ncbi:glycerol-3-phosphate dehydrogenase [Ilyomonas limi]|uniref:Glycerol-3-phosphate dehydrogenase n=1 Tax=Ilyomonas limi TaxID=2575867 RepID=A0A4V5UUC1_9BACT|nr:NAD(P)H-dependent glycerol-3-phosphate dehydrogenase [Ilyomonas limi]TKK68513.1 glycerol-3-phosphate dehydrogenase [Ilyomonas limi]
MRFGIIGSGSWATALAKILTDNQHPIAWWIRNEATIHHIQQRRHNPHYLHTAYFNTALLNMSHQVAAVIQHADVIIIAVPSAFVKQTLEGLPKNAFNNKKIISAVKGILPDCNELVNDFLIHHFSIDLRNYFTLLGPCHAEEVAAEKLSYLTFSGLDEAMCTAIASYFTNSYLNTIINHDVIGVQYAAVLKNIYALGAGIAHGLEYGDNFLSVYIANCANEMIIFLKKLVQEHEIPCNPEIINYTSSVYLGDLLVTCYSLYSRNRMFGTMIGKGYSVKAAQLELNMVAEGYNASKCIHHTNIQVQASIPIINAVYSILWQHVAPHTAFKKLEAELI